MLQNDFIAFPLFKRGFMGKTNGQSLAKQAMLLAGASLIVRFLGFLYRLPVTMMIGDEGNGIYSASFNLYALFLVISSSALPATISKLVAESDSRGLYKNSYKIFRVGMIISATLGFVCMIVLFLSAGMIENFMGIEGSAIGIRLLAPTVFLVSMLSVYRGYYQGMKDNGPTATSQVIEQVFNAIMSIVFTYLLVNISIAWGAGGSSLGTGIGAFSALIYMFILHRSRYSEIKYRAMHNNRKVLSTKKIAKKIIKTAVPITLGTAIFSLMNIVDQKMISEGLMVNFTAQENAVMYGQFSGKYILLTTLPVSIATAFAVTIIPNLAEAKKNGDYEEIENKSNMALKMTMLFCVPSAVGLTVLAEPILKLLFRTQYQGAELLVYGSIAIIFIAFSQIITGILQGLSFLYIPLVSVFFGALVKIPMNYFLIRNENINILGAVFSTIVFYLITSILNYQFLKAKFPMKLDIKGVFLKPIFSALIMGGMCLGSYQLLIMLTGNNDIATILSICLGGVTYFGVMFSIGGLDESLLRRIPVVRNYM